MKLMISYIVLLVASIVVLRLLYIAKKRGRIKSYIVKLFLKHSIKLAEIKFSSSYAFPVYCIYFYSERDFSNAKGEFIIDELEHYLQSIHKDVNAFEVKRAVNYYVIGEKFPRHFE